jgi:exopolyphosphatase/pppGpp-phosphohydrolase
VEVLKVDFDKKIYTLNENVHEERLADFNLLKNHVLESNLGKRLAWNGMVEFRAEYFPIAVILVDLVLKKLKVDSILCSRYAMKEGVFFEI